MMTAPVDRGDCRHCSVSLADRVAMTHGQGIWLCEACYSAVRDGVDAALDAPFPPNTERLPGDVYRDGGWEDDGGFPILETTAPSCDRTCLSCQGGDHPSCGLGCHDEDGS